MDALRRWPPHHGVVHGQTTSDGRRQRTVDRGVLRHHEWRDLGQCRRRRKLAVHRVASARDLFARVRRGASVAMKVRIPTPLRSYTAQAAVVDADGTTVDEVL